MARAGQDGPTLTVLEGTGRCGCSAACPRDYRNVPRDSNRLLAFVETSSALILGK
jgi:hypothetical protein